MFIYEHPLASVWWAGYAGSLAVLLTFVQLTTTNPSWIYPSIDNSLAPCKCHVHIYLNTAYFPGKISLYILCISYWKLHVNFKWSQLKENLLQPTFATKTPMIEVANSGAEDPAAMNVAPATSGDKSIAVKINPINTTKIIRPFYHQKLLSRKLQSSHRKQWPVR